MMIRSIELYVFPLEDVHCGYGLQQGNILPSLPYIPGRVMRGGLAGWAIRTGKVNHAGDPVFEELFLPPKGTSELSFPNCTHKGFFPAPASLFEVKGRGKNPRTVLVTPAPFMFTQEDAELTQGKIFAPVDFLRRCIWPSDIAYETLKPYHGQVDQDGELHPPPPIILDLKAPHEDSGRVGKGATGSALFAEEALPSSIVRKPSSYYYMGALNFVEDEKTAKVFDPLIEEYFNIGTSSINLRDPEPARLIFIGHRRVPAVVYGKDKGGIDTEKDDLPQEFQRIPLDGRFAITLTSDLIPEDSVPAYPLSAEMVESLLSLSDLEKERVFCRKDMAHGYDVQSAQKLQPTATLAAGSCGLFKTNLSEDQIRTIWGKSLLGMGQRNRDGFGRFEVNWQLHDIEEGVQ